jgi:NADH dehydrogenase FAD-containing subunit
MLLRFETKFLVLLSMLKLRRIQSFIRNLLTFVLVGASPTGVEMAAALAVLVRTTLRSDFRRMDPAEARIVLIDAAPKVLGTFAPDLSAAAQNHLEKLGVEVRLGHAVDKIDIEGVVLAGEGIASKAVIWTAWRQSFTKHTT